MTGKHGQRPDQARATAAPRQWSPTNSASEAYQTVVAVTGYLTRTLRDGEPVTYLRCPSCGTKGEIDEDQLHGRVSVICGNDGCAFHETRNWYRGALTTPWEWDATPDGAPEEASCVT